MKINVYCQNRGWLFEDLKQLIASKGATPSECPLPNYDGYICIRTREANLTPSPDKTLVQVHDMGKYDLSRYGAVSLVHIAQASNVKGKMEITPIGSRRIPQTRLPDVPMVGFFCREIPGFKKGSKLFEQVVLEARKEINFDVLMIGYKLEHIGYLGKYEKRSANIDDYARITALFTASQTPMIPISVYEACASGRSIITTPREWMCLYDGIYEGCSVKELKEQLVKVVKLNKLWHPDLSFSCDKWAEQQIERVEEL